MMTQNKTEDILLKTSEAKALLNISRDAVLQLCKAGYLKHTVLGPKTIRMCKNSVYAFRQQGLNTCGNSSSRQSERCRTGCIPLES